MKMGKRTKRGRVCYDAAHNKRELLELYHAMTCWEKILFAKLIQTSTNLVRDLFYVRIWHGTDFQIGVVYSVVSYPESSLDALFLQKKNNI